MRVLYWTELFWPHIGGVEILSLQLIRSLQRRGHDVLVVTSHSGRKLPDESRHEGIRICRFPFQKALANRDLGVLKSVVENVAALKRAFRPQVIHLNSSQPSLFFHERTAAMEPAPVLFSVHEPPADSLTLNSIVGRTLRSAAWVAAVSRAIWDRAQRLAPEIASRSSVVYNGLDMPMLKPTPISFDRPRLLCIGRMVREKGFDVALEAFREVLGQFPESYLVVAGDGPERVALERHAEALGIGHAVRFLGWVEPERVPDILNESCVVLMPSRWCEPFGLIAVQSGQMARPIVATRTGGIPEIVVEGETGLLVEPDDPRGMAERVTFLLRHPDMGRQLGRRARKRAQTLFTLERCADEYDALYRRLG